MRIRFDFIDLESFLTVAETGSFHRAAEALNVSQPTLTRRIQRLERALGAPLLERTTRSSRLTLAGKGFRSRAEAMLESAREALLAIHDGAAEAERRRLAVVTVAAIPTATPWILPRAIRAFREADRDARIRLLDGDANQVAEQVAAGEADFGISFIPVEAPGLTFEPLLDDRFVLATRSDDPLAGRDAIAWAELDASRLIVPAKGTGNRMLIDEALASARLSLRWAYEVGRSTTHLGLVEAGIGVAPLPESAIPHGSGGVVATPLVEPTISRAVGTLRRPGQSLAPAAQALLDALTRTLSRMSRARVAGAGGS